VHGFAKDFAAAYREFLNILICHAAIVMSRLPRIPLLLDKNGLVYCLPKDMHETLFNPLLHLPRMESEDFSISAQCAADVS
jgi:hypothetical protein